MAQKLSYAERVRNAHIPSSSSSLTMTEVESSPPKQLPSPLPPRPVVNVWNARMEKMAAIRAAQKIPAQDTSPSKSLSDADRDVDPFVVRMPVHPNTQPSAAPNATPPPPQTTDKTRNNGQQDNWPQVGEAISVSASPSDSSITDDGAKSVNANGFSPRKSEKTKWVSIPKQELQAAADAASATTSKRHLNSRRSHRQQPGSTTTNTDPSNDTSADSTGASSSTSSHLLSQSPTHSAHTSTSHSRAESLQSSPKLERNGKKLPPESDNQRSMSVSDGGDGSSGSKTLPANSSRSPKRDDAHRHDGSNDNSLLKKDSSTRDQRASSSRPQSSKQGYPAASSESAPLPLATNQLQPFLATPPIFHHEHTSSANSTSSNSSSPRIKQLHPLSPPPSTSRSAQSLHPHLQHPPFRHPHAPGQSTYPHAPYPLYNLSLRPMNSYDYAPTCVATHTTHYPPYPPPPDLTTPPNYGQAGAGPLLNGIGPTDRNRGSPAETSTLSTTKSDDVPAAREKMIFGSIDISSSLDDVKVALLATAEEERQEEEKEKKKPFAIGIENGHDLPRSRPLQKKAGGRTTGGRLPSLKGKSDKKAEEDKKRTREDKEVDSTVSATAMVPKVSVVEPRWTFGTTRMPSALPSTSTGAPSPSLSSQPAAKIDTSADDDTTKTSFIQPISGTTTPLIEPQGSSSFLAPPSTIPLSSSIIHPSPQHPYHVHLHRIHSPALGPTIPLPPPLSIPVQMPISMPTASSTSDPDLEVKDYGFGFGDASGLGYAPIIAKERAREWEAERARERAVEAGDIPVLGFENEDVITSPMTENGSREGADKDNIINDQNLPREHMQPREHHGRGRRGFPNARGGYGDRGAGSYRRLRGGVNVFPRGFARGGHYGSHHNRGGPGGLSPVIPRGGPSSPFNITPPHHFQTLPLDSSGAPSSLPPPPLGGFYHPHPHHPNPGRPYIPPGYEAFNPSPTIPGVPPPLPVDPTGLLLGQPQAHQHRLSQGTQGQGLMLSSGKHLTPPVPVPMTIIPFPLDSTRYYLLGQLEYYLSPENMAQDFYLRQQMDARGWIPISVIASFNRVRHLTQDVQLVRDVLTLSSLVQVRGNMVRMGGWEPFVLPDAAPSTVEEQPLPYPYQNLTNYYYTEDGTANTGPLAVNGELGTVGYSELLHATPLQHNNSNSENVEGGGDDVYSGGGDVKGAHTSMVDGHAQEVDEDDEDEVEFVMGQGVGTFMYDRRTAS